MRADGMTCRLSYSPVVKKGLCGTERIVADDPHSIGGNMYIDLPCQSCDKASIASARRLRN